MPTNKLTQEMKLDTRSKFTQVDAVISLSVDGRELPNLAVLGEALEEAVELIQRKITDSYKVVPEWVATEIAEPYAAKSET